MAFNKNALVEEIKQTLAQQAQLPEPNYSPIWVNNQTRLNASNFNDKMYKTISGYTKTLANNAYNTAAYSIEKVINYNAGWRPTNDDNEVTATSELHNYIIDNDGNVNLSEDIKVNRGSDPDNIIHYISFAEYSGNNYNIAISTPLMIWIDKYFEGSEDTPLYQPFVNTVNYAMGIRNMPNNSHAVFYIADVIRG